MIKVAICDNNIEFTSKVEDLLIRETTRVFAKVDIDVFFDETTLVKEVSIGAYYDLIYLNVDLIEAQSVDITKNIILYNPDALLIYISSHKYYEKQLFKAAPFYFINKPICYDQFVNCFYLAYNKLMSNKRLFEFNYNKELYRIPINDIIYIESNRRIIYVFVNNTVLSNKYKFYGKLNDVEKGISNNYKTPFIRIHQSFLVNYKYVTKLSLNCVELFTGSKLPISENRRGEIADYLIKSKLTSTRQLKSTEFERPLIGR